MEETQGVVNGRAEGKLAIEYREQASISLTLKFMTQVPVPHWIQFYLPLFFFLIVVVSVIQ